MLTLFSSIILMAQTSNDPRSFPRGSIDPYGLVPIKSLGLGEKAEDNLTPQQQNQVWDEQFKRFKKQPSLDSGLALVWIIRRSDSPSKVEALATHFYNKITINRTAAKLSIDYLNIEEKLTLFTLESLPIVGQMRLSNSISHEAAFVLGFFDFKDIDKTPLPTVSHGVAMLTVADSLNLKENRALCTKVADQFSKSCSIQAIASFSYLRSESNVKADEPKAASYVKRAEAIYTKRSPCSYYLGLYYQHTDKPKSKRYLTDFLASEVKSRHMRSIAQDRLDRLTK
ncbi:hypothetical protein C0431_02815 [bacterium]|nr:hypothetical protein [bacterium]